MKVYFGADHAGFELKKTLLDLVQNELGYEVEDCGDLDFDPNDDYPAFIAAAIEPLSRDAAADLEARAIVIGASGQGEAMVANRFKGVRCALYYGKAQKVQTDQSGKDLDMLQSVREHNNANALSLGARFLSVDEAKDAVRVFLATPFSDEGRHRRRIEQIDDVT